MGGWESHLLPRLVALANGETVPYDERLVMGLNLVRAEATRNHVGMAVVGEALRAWRELVRASNVYAKERRERWTTARGRLIAYLHDELTNGLWGEEPLATTNHCEYHLAIMAFARLVAVESRDAELLELTAQHCRAHGRLMATLADPTGAVHSAGWRLRVNKKGPQSPPVHDGLTVLWRMVKGMDGQAVRKLSDPLYVGLRVASDLLHWQGDNLGGMAHEQPGRVPLRHRVLVYRWKDGHQVVIPRPRPGFSAETRGSANANVVCDWAKVTYGAGKRGASKVEFGVKWETEPPCVPADAELITMGPDAPLRRDKKGASEIREALGAEESARRQPRNLEEARALVREVNRELDKVRRP